MEIKWTEDDPDTGAKRYIRAEKFAGRWEFSLRVTRRSEWARGLVPTRAMWEYLLEALRDKHQYRDGASEADIAAVERVLAAWRDAPQPRPD